MSTEFTHDVFLSHSAKDKAVVRPLAERLRQDGLEMWFEKPEMRNESESPNERNPKRAAQHPSAILPVCPIGEFELVSEFGFRDSDLKFGPPGMTAHAFGSDWSALARLRSP